MLMLTSIQQDRTKCPINMPGHLIVVLNHCCPRPVVDFLISVTKAIKKTSTKKASYLTTTVTSSVNVFCVEKKVL